MFREKDKFYGCAVCMAYGLREDNSFGLRVVVIILYDREADETKRIYTFTDGR